MFISALPIVVLDTNMLMLAADGIRVFEDIEEQLETKPRYVVLKPVYDELISLAQTAPPSIRRRARLALELVHKFCEVVNFEDPSSRSADEAILKYALLKRAIVASSDKELRSRARKLGLPEAYFREESRRVVIEGYFK